MYVYLCFWPTSVCVFKLISRLSPPLPSLPRQACLTWVESTVAMPVTSPAPSRPTGCSQSSRSSSTMQCSKPTEPFWQQSDLVSGTSGVCVCVALQGPFKLYVALLQPMSLSLLRQWDTVYHSIVTVQSCYAKTGLQEANLPTMA